MSEIKLLPCPFCGGEVEMAVDSVDAYSNAYTFCCDNCYMYTAYQFSNEKEAIEHWNTRKPMERIIEKLEHEKQEDNELRKFHRDNGTKSMEGLYVGKVNAFKDAIMIVKEEGGIE